MNDLTKEAIRRELEEAARQHIYHPMDLTGYIEYSAALAQYNIDKLYGRPKYGNDYLEPDRPLTSRARNYLTRWDKGSRCDLLDVQNTVIPDHICGICYHGKDTSDTCSRRDCPEREESRTGINLDKINRVSDDYLKISDEVDNEIGE